MGGQINIPTNVLDQNSLLMNKLDIIDKLKSKHQDLYAWLDAHPNEKWVQGPDGKWTTGEHIVHLIQSLKALNQAFRVPKFFLKYKFGSNNRKNRSYDEVVEKYHEKLAANPGVVAPISRNMPIMTPTDKVDYIYQLEQQKLKLIIKFDRWTDKDIDTYLLPHPLLGRMTIREIVMWTAYHTEHHTKILKEKY